MTDKAALEAARIIADAILELARSVENTQPYPEIGVRLTGGEGTDGMLFHLFRISEELGTVAERIEGLDTILGEIDASLGELDNTATWIGEEKL